MKLGLVTYMWGAKWDLPTLIRNCEATGFAGVELRTTHAHGVEATLSRDERMDVRKRFADSPVVCVGLGSACEYHSPDPDVVAQNIELTKQFVVLAHDIGSSGVKVRPNGFNRGEEPRRTIERIGAALRECGRFADGYGQEIRVEVHGNGTKAPSVMAEIMQAADHPSVRVCWNSNDGETVDGSLRQSFDLLKHHLGAVVHIHDLYDRSYPYRELFALLRASGFEGYTLSESPATDDPLRVMRYYRALWEELNGPRRAGS
jgi:sugar phosphate isomerase/epimerase